MGRQPFRQGIPGRAYGVPEKERALDVKVRCGRLISCLVVSAVASTALPQVACAASGSDGGAPPSRNERDVADRQKLPNGKRAPKAKRVRELKSRRTPTARWAHAESTPVGGLAGLGASGGA